MDKFAVFLSAIIFLIGGSMILYTLFFVPLNYGVTNILLTVPTRFEGSAFPDYVYPNWAAAFYFGIAFILLGFLVNIEDIVNRIFH